MNATDTVACFPSADALFGPVVEGCRDDFDFTLVFEQYFLSIVPASLLLIVAPLRLRHLNKLPRVVRGRSLRTVKCLCLIALWATQASGTIRSTSIASSSLSFVASLALCILSLAEHVRSLRPSFILNAYLLLSLAFDGAILRTLWLATAPASVRAIFTASFALKAAILVLEAREKHKYMISRERQHSPEETSGLYSQSLFWWLNFLLIAGFRELLRPADLYPIQDGMSAAALNAMFQAEWKQAAKKKGKYKLIRVCIKALTWPTIAAVFPRIMLLAFTVCQPLLLNRFLGHLEKPSESVNIGYGLIAAYGLVYVGMAVSSGFYWHRAFRMSTMLRGMLVCAIFQKTADVSITATENAAAITLMSTDVEAIERAVGSVHEIWADLMQVAIATWLLSIQIGSATAGPLAVCFLALFVLLFVAPRAKKSQKTWFEQVQHRVGITSTILVNMKTIKMSGMATRMSEMIANMRVNEMVAARPFRRVMAYTAALAQIPQLISPVAAFAIFSILALQSGETLEATRLFSSFSLIILLSQPLFTMFEVLADVLGALGSFDRIQNFLDAETRRDYRTFLLTSSRSSIISSVDQPGAMSSFPTSLPGAVHMSTFSRHPLHIPTGSRKRCAIELQDASFAWPPENQLVIDKVSFTIQEEQLMVLVGPIASGKSTLLRGILGELPLAGGSISLSRCRTSWCDQSPWLTNASIQMNILSFNHFDAELYRQVIYACDLGKDLAQLPKGDGTIVGSKGISLSGGQKQRVALARAIYSRPQIAIFDDILSGLDNYTSRTICDRVFSQREGILRKWGTTIVLATHTTSALALADHVVCLGKNGTVVEQGPFATLMRNGGCVSSLYKVANDHSANTGRAPADVDLPELSNATGLSEDSEGLDKRKQQGDFTVYRYYFASLGAIFTAVILTLEVANSFFATFPTVWLKWWSDASAVEGNESIGFYLGIYAILQCVALGTFSTLVWFLFTKLVVKTGVSLHHKLLDAVVRAPLSVFTSTDTGSITTRFSQDLGHLDRDLPLGMLVTIGSFLACIGQAALVASATGYVAISFPFLVVAFYVLQKAFLRTSRQLRFLDLEEKAPLYTQFLETLSGLSTIRAFGWENSTMELNYKLVDRSQKPFYLLLMIQRWLTLVLDLIVAALALLVVGLALKLQDSVSVGLTGVSLVQLITFAENVRILIQWWTSLETSIGAVARIKRFSEDTPNENLPGEDRLPPSQWPARGSVELRDVSASYGGENGMKALDSVSVTIQPGEKVGIVGRTGSGKSSLILTLARMLDLSSGQILIDDLDIGTLSREALRSRLIVITQDQFVLPSTSVRANLDPWATSSDPEIESALAKVGLLSTLQAKGGIGAPFGEDTLSHGQRQLFFLARAVMRRDAGRVVLLDEATSSVDAQNEARVQALIREVFAEHTVIAIAHRLETIADFDRVVVMDRGRIVEQGRPEELKRGRGPFRELWDAAGQSAM
ncbi:multidrug resistance-like protein [Xylariaceae sp. FL0016]|nr:multidrug resistance-like protein [Xylariaceae sp. FL0016]